MNQTEAKTGTNRLWEKSIYNAQTGCWIWQGAMNSEGYGQIRVEGKTLYAHRVAYESFYGPIPTDLIIDHLCRNRACINPWHMELVTNLENIQRGEAGLWFGQKQRMKPFCPNGHQYDEENTYFRPGGGRSCRACHRIRQAQYREIKKGGKYYE